MAVVAAAPPLETVQPRLTGDPISAVAGAVAAETVRSTSGAETLTGTSKTLFVRSDSARKPNGSATKSRCQAPVAAFAGIVTSTERVAEVPAANGSRSDLSTYESAISCAGSKTASAER